MMLKKRKKQSTSMAQKIFIFTLLTFVVNVYACTDFILKDLNNDVVVGRSMEFGIDLQSEIVYFPKDDANTNEQYCRQKGSSWINKYAYVGITVFGLNMVVDGMNEKGLSIETLWFPGAKYPPFPKNHQGITVPLEDLSNWILASFSSVQEAKQALKHIHILPRVLPQLNEVPPIHLSLHDKEGNSLTVEFIDGKMELLDNPVGVLTNAPKLEWHITNLRNYINLSSINKDSIIFDGSVFQPTGEGTGLLGIPGDWTPPSRFVKIAILKNFALKATTTKENINLAFHLLNTVDIPYGIIQSSNGKEYDHTQWVLVKDLSHQKLYYRTYKNMNIRCFDLKKENGKKGKKFPMKGTN
ncbi:MAG: linear amide C-N hydrolase [Chlamydiae bacterium CG10_big_fil_rev_8_21_14_0_10_35_9]|nr:MAG: linear amide C-N hydrolase [Chlamydiae bacterium CG10_big_fil_rev_8_21_14_0_10_35_9]